MLCLDFEAVSNPTYAVQYQSGVDGTNWLALQEFVGPKVNRTETVIDSPVNTNHLYRLITPP